MQIMIPIDTFEENYPQLKPTTYAVRLERRRLIHLSALQNGISI